MFSKIDAHKVLEEVQNLIKGCSYFGWSRYPAMLEILKVHLQAKNMSFTNAAHEEDYHSKILPYFFQILLTF